MPDGDTAEMAEEQSQRNEQAHVGVSITGKVKRGTETRDQDELVIKGKGADAEEAAANFEESLQAAEEKGWSQRLREMQPDLEEQDD